MEDSAPKISKKKIGASWLKIENWLTMSKVILAVGVVIFLISSFTHQVDGELASYYWMAIGIVTTLTMITIMISRISKRGTGASFINLFTLYLPSVFTLLPILGMVYVLHSVRNILVKDQGHLPQQFYTVHYLNYFFLFLQIILLNQFLNGELKHIMTKTADPNKSAYITGFILCAIVSGVLIGDLYVIVTRFITDG